jgi:hypothetical protein
MEAVLQLRCELEQLGIIKQVMFGAMICAAINLGICIMTIIQYETD